jgi:hypothetical protein
MTISRGGIHAAEKKGREKMVLVGFVSSQKKKTLVCHFADVVIFYDLLPA